MTLGFIIGSTVWISLFILYFLINKYEAVSIHFSDHTAVVLVSIIFGYGFGSLISDMIIRGFVFNHFENKLHPKYVFVIALILYALDDVWYEGFSFQNTIFSLSLGLALTYAYYRTKSVWASAGIHFGLNSVYGLFFGVSGKIGDGVFRFTEANNSTFLATWLSTLVSLILFILVFIVFRRFIELEGVYVQKFMEK